VIDVELRPTVDDTTVDRIERHVLTVADVRYVLRLVRIGRRWLASVDTDDGPSIGADGSPYLAAARALEPIGLGVAEAMALIGPVVARRRPGEAPHAD
jgi:hypothetical protein